MADMRAAMRIAEMQKQQRSQQAQSPTVGRAQQAVQNPTPQKGYGLVGAKESLVQYNRF